MILPSSLSRRGFLAAVAGGLAFGPDLRAADADKALIAVTLDLEMSRNFPRWEDTHWDYEKGNLDADTKKYTVEACRRLRARGAVVHCFVVGRVLEQEDVGWFEGIVQAGHPVGNPTYDHVNVRATRPEEVQFRFRRAPWLGEGRSPAALIRANIRLTAAALKDRLGIEARGFRTPGGFADGLASRPDVRAMLRDLGFRWVSSKYPAHPMSKPGQAPPAEVFDGLLKVQAQAQPFVYPDGLVEVPMSPPSDIVSFRTGRWQRADFLRAVRQGVEWAIEQRATFDFLGHPSCLCITDPHFEAFDLIADLVKKAGPRAALVDLDTLAERARR